LIFFDENLGQAEVKGASSLPRFFRHGYVTVCSSWQTDFTLGIYLRMIMRMNGAALQMLALCLALRSPARAQTQDGKPEGKSVFTVKHGLW